MLTLFGNAETFAIEVGPYDGGPTLRRVDLWAGGQLLTGDDGTAYVPQLTASVMRTLERLRSGCDLSVPFPGLSAAENHRRLRREESCDRERFRFASWGPTTDNFCAHLFRKDDSFSLTFELYQAPPGASDAMGVVLVSEVKATDLIATLESAVEYLAAPPADRDGAFR